MPVESRSESYCVLSVMMKLCGLIYLPPNLHQAYHNSAHTIDGCMERLRWAVPRLQSYLGSDAATHITFMYNMYSVPAHMRKYSRAVPRHIPGSRGPGPRPIDARITTRGEVARMIPGAQPATRRTSSRREETTPKAASIIISTRRHSGSHRTEPITPADIQVTVENPAEDPTPAEVSEELSTTADVPTDPEETEADNGMSDTNVMEVTDTPDAEVQNSLLPAAPVYANIDVRFNEKGQEAQEEKKRKRSMRRTSLTRKLQIYREEDTYGSGTDALRKYLRSTSIPRKVCNELIPEKLDTLSTADMDMIMARVQTLSNHALDLKMDKDDIKKKKLSKAPTCGESVGQPTDSSAQEAETEDQGDNTEEKSDVDTAPEAAEEAVTTDEGLGSSRRSRSPRMEMTRKLKSSVGKVLKKKLPRNPYHDKHYSYNTNSDTRAYTSSSTSSSRSRQREASPRKTSTKPDSRDYHSSRRREEKRSNTKSHGRR